MGRVTEIGADRLRYEAYPDAQGIDEFAYAVEDWTGRRAQGRIRVAILRSEPDAKLLARNDSAQIRPGDTMTIPVLSNDVLPDDGSGVRTRITDVQGIHSSQVQVDDDKGTVRLTAPRQAGTAYVSYVIQDTFGRTDSAILTIRIDAKIPWTPPTVSDHYVPPSDTIDQRIIQVDIANSIVDALGPQSSLTVSVHSLAAANARKLPGTDSVIEVRLTERSYAIPYMVHDSRHDLTATAFIHVPAYGAFPPSHRPHAPLLRVKSGETIRFDVNDHVRVGAGKHAYVPSQDSVHATKSESGTRPLSEIIRDRHPSRSPWRKPPSLRLMPRVSQKTPQQTAMIRLITLRSRLSHCQSPFTAIVCRRPSGPQLWMWRQGKSDDQSAVDA